MKIFKNHFKHFRFTRHSIFDAQIVIICEISCFKFRNFSIWQVHNNISQIVWTLTLRLEKRYVMLVSTLYRLPSILPIWYYENVEYIETDLFHGRGIQAAATTATATAVTLGLSLRFFWSTWCQFCRPDLTW